MSKSIKNSTKGLDLVQKIKHYTNFDLTPFIEKYTAKYIVVTLKTNCLNLSREGVLLERLADQGFIKIVSSGFTTFIYY